MKFQKFLKIEDVNPSDLTPAMKQYYGFKVQYPDFILFFRAGEFFETYFEDAAEFSSTTGVTLTRKKYKSIGSVLMAGIPHKNIGTYVEKLIKAGFKVAVVDQVEQDKETKRLKRKVTKIYTQGTLLELELLNAKENNYLASLYKEGEIYELCYADVSVGDVFLTKGDYEEIKCELARISPKELLLPMDVEIEEDLYSIYRSEKLSSEFYEGIEEYPSYQALLNYAKYILKELFPKLEGLIIYPVGQNLLMDFTTRKNLELIRNSYNNKKYGSLFWALDNCKTPMGKRLLSSFISTPLYNLEEIKKRQEAVFEFLQKQELADGLGRLLENIGDLSRIASRLSNQTISPLEFMTLKDGLRVLKEIEDIKKKLKSSLLSKNAENREVLADFYEILDKTLEEDIDKIKDGDYIRPGANEAVDLLVFEYQRCLEELKKYEETLKAYTGIKALKIVRKGANYSIEIPASSINPVGADFKLVQRLKSSFRYTTGKLVELQEKIFSCRGKIDEASKSVFENLKKYAKELTDEVREYSKTLAIFDVIYSLYAVSNKNHFVCPNIALDGKFTVKEGRHFAAEKILGRYEPLGLNFKNKNFIMLTGANGIGKSTFLKEIGLIIVLAQAGAFIPAEYGELPLVDKLFTVLNVNDDIVNKKSTHQAQMRDVAKIIKNATDKSVILLDEIGKNTSYKDGVSLSYGVMKFLIEEIKAKTIYSTHFFFLEKLAEEFKERILCLEISNKTGKRKIEEGVAEKSRGIEIAQKEDLPEKIIKYANEVNEIVQVT